MTVRELRQLLVVNDLDIVFLSETKLRANEFERIWVWCKMDGCYVVDFEGRRKGLALL